jgi:hypothetical protein
MGETGYFRLVLKVAEFALTIKPMAEIEASIGTPSMPARGAADDQYKK